MISKFTSTVVCLLLIASFSVHSESKGAAGAAEKLVATSAATISPLVELYTSEGCSSCPPADQFISDLGKRLTPDFHAVPLAFHVDYWNRLGWTDPFSKAQYTERQREVAGNNQQSSIYTPELVVAGREARGGGRVFDYILEFNQTESEVKIVLEALKLPANQLQAIVDFEVDASAPMPEAHVAIFENGISRAISGGENSGKTLKHDFVVRYWSHPVSLKTGASRELHTLTLEPDWQAPNLGVAVVVVDSQNGETLQAVSLPLGSLF